MKSVHQDLLDELRISISLPQWNITEIALNFLEEKTKKLNQSVEVETISNSLFQVNWRFEWESIAKILNFYIKVMKGFFMQKHWSSKNIGSFLMKSLNLINWAKCDPIGKY